MWLPWVAFTLMAFSTWGPRHVVTAYVTALRKLWKASDPQFLSIDADLNFLGVSSRQLATGLLLHRHHYTEQLLSEHASHITARKRTTMGEPEHFNKQAPLPPDHSNIDHLEWTKSGQQVLGAMLMLSTRTRSDLAYAVSATAQVLTRDIESLKVRLRRLLQHINTAKTLGLFYRFPAKGELTDFTLFGDASFAPSGKHPNPATLFVLSFGCSTPCQLAIAREAKIAESSAEAQLYALAIARGDATSPCMARLRARCSVGRWLACTFLLIYK